MYRCIQTLLIRFRQRAEAEHLYPSSITSKCGARYSGARCLAHPHDYAERESLICHPLICAGFIESPTQSMTPTLSREGNTFLSLMRVDKTRR